MEIVSNFESSNIQKIGYDEGQSTLQIWFLNGTAYQYFEVPSGVWEAFKTAESKGKFLQSSIRGKFRYTKV